MVERSRRFEVEPEPVQNFIERQYSNVLANFLVFHVLETKSSFRGAENQCTQLTCLKKCSNEIVEQLLAQGVPLPPHNGGTLVQDVEQPLLLHICPWKNVNCVGPAFNRNGIVPTEPPGVQQIC